jgi:GNAT superfamily N-acetyltransferase
VRGVIGAGGYNGGMKLPLAGQEDRASPDALVRAVKRAAVILARTVAEETALDGATVFVGAEYAHAARANHATDLRLGPDTAASPLLDRIDDHFRSAAARCLRLRAAETHWPAALADAARARGFASAGREVWRLDGYRRPSQARGDVQIIPARAAYGEIGRLYPDDAATAAIAGRELDEPRLDALLGRVDGRPVGMAGVLSLGQVGVLWPVHVAAEHRGRGIGAALLAAVIELCQRAVFEQVIVELNAGCPAGRLYARVGFEAAAEFDDFERR